MRRALRQLILIILAAGAVSTAGAVRVFLTGDSHVSAKVYARRVGEILKEKRPADSYAFYGKGAAGFYTFNDTPAMMDSIFVHDPDVIVVHLGTNGSYSAFDPVKFRADVDTFYSKVKSRLPESRIILVTPFLNRLKPKDGRAGEINYKTRACADLLKDFSEEHEDVTVIDNNAAAGTVFLDGPGLIRDDNVHLTAKGYRLLGDMVGNELVEILNVLDE